MILMLFKKTEVRRSLVGSPPVAACKPSEVISKQDIMYEDMGCGVPTRCIGSHGINWGKKVAAWLGGKMKVIM